MQIKMQGFWPAWFFFILRVSAKLFLFSQYYVKYVKCLLKADWGRDLHQVKKLYAKL